MKQRVGPYEILDKIGEGGMGSVWRARDTRLDRTCALKFVSGSNSAESRRRLLQEARAASALNHPNIVTIFDFGQDGGHEFIVMECVPGQSLAAMLRSKALSVETAFHFSHQIAAALQAAHNEGIIHRDLKPGNIMITPENRVKVLDFGLARREPGLAAALSQPAPAPETTISGTLSYLAPEQALGLPVDHRADQFAFGCVLYECLSGRRAFPAADLRSSLQTLLTRHPPPIPDLPPVPAALLQRCLQKSPADRYEDMAAVVAAIENAIQHLAAGPLIAILPFTGVNAPAADAWFTEGLSDEIALGLTRLPGLRVLARTSSGILSQTNDDLYSVAHRLGVSRILEGRVTSSSGHLRVIASLLEVPSGTLIWSERFDRPLDDLFALQDDIARAVVMALKLQILGQRKTPIVPSYGGNLEIHNRYLQGYALAQRYGDQNLVRGLELLEDVVQRAPGHAPARAAYGIALSHAAHAGLQPAAELVPRAAQHLRRAIELDPGLAEAWSQLGLIEFSFEHDPANAERSFHRALETNSRDPFACSLYAICFLAPLGRFDLALDFAAKALDLDPLSPVHHLR